ncbi:MAG: sigma-54 dependent transcriptional regulator [Sedimentisphaerales bacterium]
MEKKVVYPDDVSGTDASKQNQRQFVGCSTAFQSILETIRNIAWRETSVIITGETGTGKEIVARQIHEYSPRGDKPFVPVDCASLGGQLFESELFGHTKGSFTGAFKDTLGFFRAADGGTIFLDEISEMDLDLQAKLLRVLQESTVTPVGSTRQYPLNVRVICATNRDLRQMVRSSTFRADLYFRINVIKLAIPPLKDRKEDIPVLAEHFLARQAALYGEMVKTLTPEALKILEDYDWPGNVRELANAMEHAHVTSRTNIIRPISLPVEILIGETMLPMQSEALMTFGELEKRMVISSLQKSNGRKMAAARLLNIDHRKLANLIEKFNLQPTWK